MRIARKAVVGMLAGTVFLSTYVDIGMERKVAFRPPAISPFKKHSIVVAGQSWAEGIFRRKKDFIEKRLLCEYGLDARITVLSKNGAKLPEIERQVREGIGSDVVIVFPGRNDFSGAERMDEKRISTHLQRWIGRISGHAGKIRLVIVNSHRFFGKNALDRLVGIENRLIDSICALRGIPCIDISKLQINGWRDFQHPQKYAKLRNRVIYNLARILGFGSKIGMRLHGIGRDKTSVAMKQRGGHDEIVP